MYEIAYAPGGGVESFAADFLRKCAYGPETLVGSIRFNTSDALPELFDQDGDGRAEIADVCPGLSDPDQHDGDLDGAGDACDPSLEATFLRLDSEPGEVMADGVDSHLNASNAATFDAHPDSFGGVTFFVDPGELWLPDYPRHPWRMTFEPPDGRQLAPWVYDLFANPDAGRSPRFARPDVQPRWGSLRDLRGRLRPRRPRARLLR